MFAYVGCRTTKKRNARGKGISCYEINDKGDWTHQKHYEDLENPSFSLLSGQHPFSIRCMAMITM